nr:portal protein [Bathymodiolus japonicus methanotrophic gill symbiont]
MQSIRQPFEDDWRDLSEQLFGSYPKFDVVSKRDSREEVTTVINNTAKRALRTLAAGLMSGVSSPARPWVNFVTSDRELMEKSEVRIWLSQVEYLISQVMSKSNMYSSLHSVYYDLGSYGTSAIGIYDDYDDVIMTECYEIGTYYIDINSKGMVDTFYRVFTMTANDIINKFGKDALPDSFKYSYKDDLDTSEFKIIHAIEPNKNMKSSSKMSKHKEFVSTYVYYGVSSVSEPISDLRNNKVLMTSGYDQFPIMCGRWHVSPGKVYGERSPGMLSLGDMRMLQRAERNKYQALDKLINPALMNASTTNNIGSGGLEPGQIIQVDNTKEAGLVPVYNVNYDLPAVINDIYSIEKRIDSTHYVDLFQQMLQSDRREMTRAEVDVRSSETMLSLGPVLTGIHSDLLGNITDRVFNICAKHEILPEAPEELQGTSLELEYISTLAKAQRADVSVTVEKTAAFVAGLSESFPMARHKLNAVQAINEFSIAESSPPKMIVSDQDAMKAYQQEQEQMAQQQQQQMALEAAKVAPGVAKATNEMKQEEEV